MPETRQHRGPHPEDAALFAPAAWLRLRRAVAELSWLLGRGYASDAAVKLVGDHHQLHQRQRVAVWRCACSDQALARRRAHQADAAELSGQALVIDGFNVLTSVEAALGGGVLLLARDGCVRDMASMHGSYRKVQETAPAIELAGQALAELGVASCRWLLDSPVSNSGRLKVLLRAAGQRAGWDWQIEVVPSPDRMLIESDQVVATADGAILDRCGRWFNLARGAIQRALPEVKMVDLSSEESGAPQ